MKKVNLNCVEILNSNYSEYHIILNINLFTLTEFMSKKGLSVDQKRTKSQEYFFETVQLLIYFLLNPGRLSYNEGA